MGLQWGRSKEFKVWVKRATTLGTGASLLSLQALRRVVLTQAHGLPQHTALTGSSQALLCSALPQVTTSRTRPGPPGASVMPPSAGPVGVGGLRCSSVMVTWPVRRKGK